MEGKYLDPKADLTFKLIFEHEDLLISLLNALLPGHWTDEKRTGNIIADF